MGDLLFRLYQLFRKKKPFTSSEEYWEERYRKGGNSGIGSYDKLAQYKAEVINDFVVERNIETVFEFGCGDGNQLTYFNFPSYVGYDVSPSVIDKCKAKYTQDQTKKFALIDQHSNEKADLSLSLDVIYHLVESPVYLAYMEKLFSSTDRFVVVYSSNSDVHENNDKVAHVKHRKFTDWVSKNKPDFELIQFIPNKYPFNPKEKYSSYADFYIFKKKLNP